MDKNKIKSSVGMSVCLIGLMGLGYAALDVTFNEREFNHQVEVRRLDSIYQARYDSLDSMYAAQRNFLKKNYYKNEK